MRGLLIKLAISGGLLWWVLREVDLQRLAANLAGTSWWMLIPVVVLFLPLALVQAERWRCILQVLGGELHYPEAARVMLLSLFFNQTLPSTVGGDLIRVRYATKAGNGWKLVTASVVVDRIVGLMALLLFSALGLVGIREITGGGSVFWSAALLAAAIFGAVVLLLVLRWLPGLVAEFPVLREVRGLSRALWSLLANRAATWHAFLVSLLVQGAAILAVYYLAWILGISIAPVDALAIIPVVLLISMLPVSVAGWGVREGAMAIGLGLVDVPSDAAVAVSVLFGFVMLGSGLLGGGLGIAPFWSRFTAPGTAGFDGP